MHPASGHVVVLVGNYPLSTDNGYAVIARLLNSTCNTNQTADLFTDIGEVFQLIHCFTESLDNGRMLMSNYSMRQTDFKVLTVFVTMRFSCFIFLSH